MVIKDIPCGYKGKTRTPRQTLKPLDLTTVVRPQKDLSQEIAPLAENTSILMKMLKDRTTFTRLRHNARQ